MHNTIRILLAIVFTASLHAQIKFTPHTFEAGDGTKVEAELGELRVRENRTKDDSRLITLKFVRFPSTSKTPGSPIVYLAGGPGGSGVEAARGARFPMFQALRAFGDVIAYDQRGVGLSEADMRCTESFMFPFDQPIDRAKGGAAMADAARKCAERLAKKGIDVAAYNTRENAADVDDLRKALGAKKISLVGISYGTHLGLAILRDYSQHLDRVVLAGLEGPDDTEKLPSDQQELMNEIAKLAKPVLPELNATIAKLLKELAAKPQTVSLTHPVMGMTVPVTVGALDLQVALAQMLTGPETFGPMTDFVGRLAAGDWTALALASARFRMGNVPNAMSIAMDCAAGATPARRKQIASEAKDSLLGDAINLPYPEICAGFPYTDAGDAFRGPVKSNVPVLLISGTLDGRTRPRQAEEVRKNGLKNATHLVIEGAGHSDPLFVSTPKIGETMQRFFRGEKLADARVAIDPPVFMTPRKVVTLSDDVLNRYVGTYKINEKTNRRVVKAGTLLYSIRDGSQPFPLRPMSETEFFLEGTPTKVTFEVNGEGKVTGMVLDGNRAPRTE